VDEQAVLAREGGLRHFQHRQAGPLAFAGRKAACRKGEEAPLTDARSQGRRPSLASAVLGLAFVLIGAGALVGLFYIGDSRTPAAEHAMITLGLAGSVLASAVAQTLLVVGLWLIWRATRRGRGQSDIRRRR
jgi:hypothetical protein